MKKVCRRTIKSRLKKNKVHDFKRVDYYVHLIKYSCRVPNQENSQSIPDS